MRDDDDRPVRPRGHAVRRLRLVRGWSPQELCNAVGEAQSAATGIWETITPSVLEGIEERDEVVPYATLCLLASGFDCDPVDLLETERPGASPD